MKIIKGTQSTIYIDEISNIVKKVGTERGKQDTIDQISFYLSIQENIKEIFPQLISYVNGPEEYSYTYKYIGFPNLRQLLLDGVFDETWRDKLVSAMLRIIEKIHTISRIAPLKESIYDTFISRCERRVSETQKYIGQEFDLWKIDVCIDGVITRRPIFKIVQFFRENFEVLIPSYICTTHGQLGPSHIFLSEEDNQFVLIDPKGFDVLYDPVIDFCKIGKAMLFATEWLEENRYHIDYHVQDNLVNIKEYHIENYEFARMKECYDDIISRIPLFDSKETRIRNMAMICADLIGGLPFAYVAGGTERVIALLAQISIAAQILIDEYGV